MLKFVGLIFGAVAGLIAAGWLYGGSTWGPGFAAKQTATRGIDAPKFKLSSEPPPAKPAGDPPPATSETPLRPTADASPPVNTEAPNPSPYNTGGNPNLTNGAGPNWGLGYGVGRTGK